MENALTPLGPDLGYFVRLFPYKAHLNQENIMEGDDRCHGQEAGPA
ncbi:hypothetical protein GFS31_28520 [Leptolyngbya sp. BL0902]|nr:hypothetical protein GFS31_28520 [Leptolyngbya sp. BL0902]